MNIILRTVGKLMGWNKPIDRYWFLFMQPKMDYARSIGMPKATLHELAQRAVNEADGIFSFPGMLLRDFIAEWEDKNHNEG